MDKFYRVEADIYLDNIRDNVKLMKACIPPEEKMLVVIKADAYGHGAIEVSRALDDIADFYAVACIDEAMELVNSGCTKPLLILGYTDESAYSELILNEVRPAVYNFRECNILSDMAASMGKKAKVHVKVDTGMGRIGFPCNEEGVEQVVGLSKLKGLELEGIFTHYAKADEADKTSAKWQQERFRWFIKELSDRGINIPVKHISNSAGIMEMNNQGFDMARCGIVTYGLYPSDEVDSSRLKLKPAMEWSSRVIHVKDVKAGTGIGYGWSYTAPEDMRVATVSAGYADGYPRAQSNRGRVIINGKYAPIIGRVCMDQFMVDVTHIENVCCRDKVILVGQSGNCRITMEEVAEPAASFNYELVCNVGRRVPRIYIRDGKVVSVMNYLLR